jgi:predicted nucleotidyltransferase
LLHHEASIDAFVASARDTARCDAVIVAGSVARGTERPNSDIDLYLLVTDEAFAAARAGGTLSTVEGDGVTYEGGYFDIKLITVDYLDRAATDGDDPCRASFDGARVAWSRLDGLESRIARVVQLPDAAWRRRQAAFVTHARLQTY